MRKAPGSAEVGEGRAKDEPAEKGRPMRGAVERAAPVPDRDELELEMDG
ncbi:hypothetical protein BQ8482_111196 [Mesorhizobium delmotii]|uniref:Uncharacterized protein n=1 Tax=Mesorhizobium delmotii TaxID=1631247 RepID=A0A2P9ADU0_9HYPH|nr:hypothetical protein BQ8482_111196 [Mesorhizobium delmotii]